MSPEIANVHLKGPLSRRFLKTARMTLIEMTLD